MKTFLEHVSFWGAVLAALLLATKTLGGWAFVIFIVSNITTIILLRQSNASKWITYQGYVFVVVNIIGVYCWLL